MMSSSSASWSLRWTWWTWLWSGQGLMPNIGQREWSTYIFTETTVRFWTWRARRTTGGRRCSQAASDTGTCPSSSPTSRLRTEGRTNASSQSYMATPNPQLFTLLLVSWSREITPHPSSSESSAAFRCSSWSNFPHQQRLSSAEACHSFDPSFIRDASKRCRVVALEDWTWESLLKCIEKGKNNGESSTPCCAADHMVKHANLLVE